MTTVRGALTVGLLVAGLLGAARTSDGAIVAPPAGDPVAGKATFTQYCSICHGVAGAGFIGPHIAGIDWTVAGLHAIVRHGVGGYGGMPAFNAAVVTDKNIADIAAFLAARSAPPASQASTSAAAPPSALPSASPAPPTVAAQAGTSQSGNLVHGRAVYSANCAACHGANAEGGFGPTLHGEKNRKDIAAAIAWIKNPKLPMPKLYPDPLSEKDVDDVAAYIESL
jgi:mono/diheme cytochrome c family protein